MRRRHVLEPVEEGDPNEDIDIPLSNFMKKINNKKEKKRWLFMNDLLLNIVNEYCVNELFMNDLLLNVAC